MTWKKWIGAWLLMITPCSMLFAQNPSRETVYFGYDKDHLTSEAKQTLDDLLISLGTTNQHFTLRGHTDNHGNHTYNQDLSLRRCQSVERYLTQNGISASRIHFSGFSFDLPKATNATNQGRAHNRRVSIQVHPAGSTLAGVIGFDVPFQVFETHADQDNTLELTSGTKFEIPAHAFEAENGTRVTGVVEIRIREFEDPLDFIASGIPMNHGDGHFHSGGMFEVRAFQRDQEVQVAPGKSLDVNMAMTTTNDTYDFWEFDQEKEEWTQRNDLTNGPVSWSSVPELVQAPVLKSKGWKGEEVQKTEEQCPWISENPVGALDHALQVIEESLDRFSAENGDYTKFHDRYRKLSYAGVRKLDSSWSEADPALFNLAVFIKPSVSDHGNELVIQDFTGRNKELKAWDNTTFTLVSLPSNISTIANQRFTDVRFATTTIPDHMKIELKRPDGFVELRVKVHHKKRRMSPEKVAQLKVECHQDYLELLNDRASQFNQQYANLYQRRMDERAFFELNLHEDRTCFWQFMKPYISFQEVQNGRRSWYLWAFEHRPLVRERLDSLRFQYAQVFDQSVAYRAQGFERIVAMENKFQARKDSLVLVAQMERKRKYQALMEVVGDSLQGLTADMSGTVNAISQTIQLNSTGVFNADAVKSIKEPLLVEAKYMLPHGQEVFPQVAFVMNSELNGVFKYDGYRGYSPYKMMVSKVGKTKLLLVDEEGVIFHLPEGGLIPQLTKKKGSQYLTVFELNTPKNKKELETEFAKPGLAATVSLGL